MNYCVTILPNLGPDLLTQWQVEAKDGQQAVQAEGEDAQQDHKVNPSLSRVLRTARLRGFRFGAVPDSLCVGGFCVPVCFCVPFDFCLPVGFCLPVDVLFLLIEGEARYKYS